MSTADEVKEHNEKAIRNLERAELVAKFAESIGCTDAQAATISKAYADRFVYDGATLSFNGRPVIAAAEDFMAHCKTHGLDFLLPTAGASERSDVDPSLIESARTNLTAKGRLYKLVGAPMAEQMLAETPASGDSKEKADADPAFKGKSNPWRPEHWSVTEQGRIVKTLGVAVAQRMAEAANSRVGATHPSRAA